MRLANIYILLFIHSLSSRLGGDTGGRGGRGGAGSLHTERSPGGGEEQSHNTRPLPVPGAQGTQLAEIL